MLNDETLKKVYCEWAKQKYGLASTPPGVQFNIGRDGPYSPDTPDVYVYVEVVIEGASYNGGPRREQYDDPHALIRELLEFYDSYMARRRAKQRMGRPR